MIHRRPCVWSADATPACHRRPPSDTIACDVCVCRHNGGDYVELPTDDMMWWLPCHNGRCCWREAHAGAGNEPENRFPLCRPISPVYTVAAALLAVGLLVKNIAAVIAVISGICFIVCQYRVAFTVVIIVQSYVCDSVPEMMWKFIWPLSSMFSLLRTKCSRTSMTYKKNQIQRNDTCKHRHPKCTTVLHKGMHADMSIS